jgi:hypothetical protein
MVEIDYANDDYPVMMQVTMIVAFWMMGRLSSHIYVVHDQT